MTTKLQIKTDRRNQMVDITERVASVVRESGAAEGICTVYSPHTTAAITINEGHDPDVVTDILNYLEKLVPPHAGYRHMEGNSDSHIKVALIGPGQTIPIENGRLAFGTWQRIFFCEFDGPRSRTCLVTVNK